MQLKLAGFITLEQGDTGDVASVVFPPINYFIATLPFDNMFLLNQKELFGSKIYGLGNQYLTNNSYGISSSNKLHFYFFNTSTTATLNNEGKLPSFMSNFLDFDESKLVAYATDVTVIDSNKPKQGITKEREGIINTTQPVIGCTMYWPAGYGVGEINAMAVSLVDLSTLKTLSSSDASRSAVFGGVQFYTTTNYTGYLTNYGYLKPGTQGFTTEEEMIIRVGSTTYLYNFTTGDKSLWEDTFPATQLPFFGVNYAKVGDKIYYASLYGSSQYRVTEVDLSTKTARYGGAKYDVDYLSSAILKDGEVWFQAARNNTSITLEKLNIETLSIDTATTITVSLPSYFSTANRNNPCITQFNDGHYGLLDGASGICYKFTDLEDVEGSIVDVFFTGATSGYPCVPVRDGLKTTKFLAISASGFYQNTTLAGKNSGQYKLILADGRYGPLIAYNKFDTSYNKSETSELTSSFMITASAL